MSSPHGDLGPELRRLAQVILDRLDPAVQAASAAAQGRGDPGRCQQVWCPVCALAALVAGEQHPLLTVIAEHSVSLMAVIGAMVADAERAADAQSAPPKPRHSRKSRCPISAAERTQRWVPSIKAPSASIPSSWADSIFWKCAEILRLDTCTS